MKKWEKQMIIILVAVAILAIVILKVSTNKPKNEGKENEVGKNPTSSEQGQFTHVAEDGTVVNTSEQFKKNREESGFLINNIDFREANGETIITARITNNSGTSQEGFFGNIVLLDQEDNEIGKIPVRVSETQNEETIEIEASITENYANAYNFRLEK